MEKTLHAVELYRDGLSRRQIAASMGVSDMAVRNAFGRVGHPMRSQASATAESNRRYRNRRRRIASVFHLARSPSPLTHTA